DTLGRVIQEIGPEDYDASLDGLPTANTYSDSSAGTTYVYASNNTLSSETNRLGKTTHYYYNDRGCKTREEFDIYKFYYRDHGELTQVQVNGVQKVLYGYENATNLLQTVTYANDDVINYYYDSNKNLISEKRNDNNAAYVTYSYNSDNELTEKVNYDTGLRYTYGSNDSVTVTKLSDDSVVQTYTQSSNEDQVDSEDAVVTTINESHFGTSYSSQVTNRSTTFTAGSNSVNYTFTNNNSNNVATEAVSFNNSPAFTTAYSYDSKENITSKAITLADNTTIDVVNTYDSKNRITSTGYGSAEQTYTYDQYGQLTQTVDAANGFTETYSYDQRGNILTKTKVYDDTSLPAETTNFSYGNSAWPDELTSVNGTSLTYDANGNVLTYGNMEFEWTNGRTLSQITVNPEDENGTADVYSYTYDESGIRSSKTVNGVTTYFTTKDGVILSQTDGTNTMYFQYDNSGNPTGFLYNGTQYFYLTNQMGDVIGITDNTGSLIATYTYDAWGEVLAVTPATTNSATQLAIANANPLRYRGYYLDAETGYYYLRNRYYDPSITRFINVDDFEIYSTFDFGRSKCLYDGYLYCINAPASYIDPDGDIPDWVAIGLRKYIAGTLIGWRRYSEAKLLLSTAGTAYLNKKGYYLASRMYYHGIWGNGKAPGKSITNLAINKLKASQTMKNFFKNKCKRYKSRSSIKKTETVEFPKNSEPDLYYSLQHVTVSYSGKKKGGSWTFNITVSDRYDFDNMRFLKDRSFGAAANDLGVLMQKAGMMVPYNIRVSYSQKYNTKGLIK
ncbi:MAG: RHS repeat-associated core domain-containing protein, partial [Clostridia bacterium]|nr:RHS repeat-associated core domain-containing protein [Clostridia bacterium]